MKIQLWAIAIAIPLTLAGCNKEPTDANAEPPRTPDVPNGQVLSAPPTRLPVISDDVKKARHAELVKFVEKSLGRKPEQAEDWDDAVSRDLVINYASCTLSNGDQVPKENCHLYVEKPDEQHQGDPSAPLRWFRIEKKDKQDKHYWAVIRSYNETHEFMYCGDLAEENEPSYVEGWCLIQPHFYGGLHWVVANVVKASASEKYDSVYFRFWDEKPVSGQTQVHNGEGHGGSD
jgi:hypothetical protein